MSSLQSAGKSPTGGRGVQTAYQANQQLSAAPTSRPSADGRVATLAASKATKGYVDSQDEQFTTAAYFAQQDALLVPLSGRGVPGGVASLGPDGKIPASQVPALGSGWLKGPWGHVNAYPGTTGQDKLKIADWGTRPGVTGLKCAPWVWMNVAVTSTRAGRPVIEVRMGGPADTSYASQVLVARGYGRLYYEDSQPVTVRPCADLTGRMQDNTQFWVDPNLDLRLTAWLYDATPTGQSTFLQPEHIVASSAWLEKVVT